MHGYISKIHDTFMNKKTFENKGQCTTGPTATTVQSSKPKFDMLTPGGPGQEFS